MAISQSRPKRKASGGRYVSYRGKRKYELGYPTVAPKIGKKKIKVVDAKFGQKKVKVLAADKVNVYIPKEKKCKVVKIENVVENPADAELVRRNILTKSAVVKTKLGNVRITSRPAQDGCVNGVLIE